MNVWSANFQELYARHLCRHSQYGINVVHLAAVVGMYLSLYGIAYGLLQSEWALVGVAVAYLAILAINVPVRVLLVNVVFMVLFFAALLTLPLLAWWWYVAAIVVLYKLQAWSHKLFSKESDMTEFNRKYQKGFALFVLLSIYELPILLNYLVFGREDWCA